MVAESLTQDQVQARAMGAGASLDTALGVEVGESQAQVSITRNPRAAKPASMRKDMKIEVKQQRA